MELFKKRNLIYWDLKTIEREKNEKLKTLKLESAKIKAIEKAKRLTEEKKQYLKDLESYNEFGSIEISITWNKSRTWGMNPTATLYTYNYQKSERITKSASGCGYDKLSSVVAYCLNDSDIVTATMIKKVRKLNALLKENNRLYGIDKNFVWSYGVGINSFKDIFKKLGYNFEHYETKTSDFIKISKNK